MRSFIQPNRGSRRAGGAGSSSGGRFLVSALLTSIPFQHSHKLWPNSQGRGGGGELGECSRRPGRSAQSEHMGRQSLIPQCFLRLNLRRA